MPLAEWPSEDRDLWLTAIRDGDVLDDAGPRAKLRSPSNRKMQQGYGRFLTFLERNDFLEDRHSALPKIVQSTVVRYVSDLRELGNSSGTILGRLQELHDVVRSMKPENDWSWIRLISSRVRAVHVATIEKRKRMVGTEDLVIFGQQLMRSAGGKRSPRTAGIDFRDGLMIALLALRPLRLRNLAALELDRTLYRHGAAFRISFEADEVKNAVPLAFDWPTALLGSLHEWLDRYRPILGGLRHRWTRDIGNAVWISSHGSPMTKQAIYDRITKRTHRAFGAGINPHLFRDVAATTQALRDPGRVLIAASLLGHTAFGTTEKYYLQARMVEAANRYQEQLLKLRNHTRKTKT